MSQRILPLGLGAWRRALPGLERLDVVRDLALQEVGASAPVSGELAAARAVDETAAVFAKESEESDSGYELQMLGMPNFASHGKH